MNNETRNIILSIAHLKKYIFENIELSEDNKENLKTRFDYINSRLDLLISDEIKEAKRVLETANYNMNILDELSEKLKETNDEIQTTDDMIPLF